MPRTLVFLLAFISFIAPIAGAQAPLAWSQIGGQGGPVHDLFIDPADPSRLLLGTEAGGLWTSSNGGASWTRRDDFSGASVRCLAGDPAHPAVVYACADGLHKSIDAGRTWTHIPMQPAPDSGLSHLAISQDGSILLGVAGMNIYRSVDGGAAWTLVVGGTDVAFLPGSSTAVVATGSYNSWYSTDGGATWTDTSTGPQGVFGVPGVIGVTPAAPATVYLVSHRDAVIVYKSPDGGRTYATCGPALEPNGSVPAAVWVDPANPNRVWAGGDDLWQSTDGCATWTRLTDKRAPIPVVRAGQRRIVPDPRYTAGTRRLYFLTDGGVYKTEDAAAPAGPSFAEIDGGLFVHRFASGAAHAPTRTVIGSTYEGVLRGVAGAAPSSWQLIVSNATVPSFNAQRGETGSVAIDPSNPAYIYGPRGPFAGNGAFLPALFRRTLDGGATWDVLEVPGENPTLRPKFMLDPNDPNTMLHAGCSLQRSTNIRTPLSSGGPFWTKILAPGNVCGGVPEFGAIAVAQGDSNTIWAAYRSGDILKTVNGTAATPAWTQVDTAPPGLPRREPTRIVIDPRDHDVVYISYPESTDNLWKTTDGGLSWTGASGSGSTALPNVAVRSLAIHPRISSWLYAGTDAGVFRSTDGGATWSTQGPDVVPIADLFWLGTDLVAATDGRSMFVAPTTALAMSLDDPKPSQSLAPTIVVRGWGFDQAAASGTGVDAIHVYGFPNPGSGAPPVFLGSATFVDRDDVAAVFGSRYRHSGFELTIGSLTPGPWMIVAYPRSTVSQSFDISRAVTFTVAPAGSRPALAIDAPSGTVGPAFTVRGWALDAGGSASAGVDAVHVYALPASGGAATFLGVAGYGQTRWDVASVYGARFVDSGYALTSSTPLAPGVYTLVVYARSTVSGQWFWQTRAITVRPPGDPLMTIDTPSSGATAGQPFLLAGWAIDRDATSGSGVDTLHVWAFPADGGAAQFVGAVTTGGVRGDVGAAYGSQFANSGYNVTVSGLAPGHYQIAVYAHSTVTGTFNQARVVTVQVP